MSDLGIRAISETDMRALLDARKQAREAYNTHVVNRHIWQGMDSAYEAKRAVLWGLFTDAAFAVAEASGGEVIDRRYTIQEIDALRRAVENKYLWGRYSGPVYDANGQGGMSRQYKEEEKVKVVEAQVRTLMMAGLTAEDLLKDKS